MAMLHGKGPSPERQDVGYSPNTDHFQRAVLESIRSHQMDIYQRMEIFPKHEQAAV